MSGTAKVAKQAWPIGGVLLRQLQSSMLLLLPLLLLLCGPPNEVRAHAAPEPTHQHWVQGEHGLLRVV